MKRWERWTFNLLALVVATSGFAYLWMKDVLRTDDPFALVNHPWQPAMLNVHVLASPVFILVFGVILNSHIMKKLRTWGGPNRVTGFVSLGMFACMLMSGYLLQVATSEALTSALFAAHVLSSGVFTLAYAAHLLHTLVAVRRRSPAGAVRGVA